MDALEQVKDKAPEVELFGKELKPTFGAIFPPTEGELLAKANALGEQLRALVLLAKQLPKNNALEPHQDRTRSLSLAQMYLQTGFMWLRRTITPPKEF